jgi:hypothetical protein
LVRGRLARFWRRLRILLEICNIDLQLVVLAVLVVLVLQVVLVLAVNLGRPH